MSQHEGSLSEQEYIEANPGEEGLIKQLREEGYLLSFRGIWQEYYDEEEDEYDYVLIHSRISYIRPEQLSPGSIWGYD